MIEVLPNWHPVFVHFSVSLLTLSVLAFFVSNVARTYNAQFQARLFGRWCLWLGVAFSVATVAAGMYAYYTVNHDTPSHVVMTTHRNLAIGTFFVFFILSIWSIVNYRSDFEEGKSFLITSLIGLVLLFVTAWHGGELVYRYGLGVESIPQKTGQGHDHGAHDHGTPPSNQSESLMDNTGMVTPSEKTADDHPHSTDQPHQH